MDRNLQVLGGLLNTGSAYKHGMSMTVKIHSEKSRQTSVAMAKWHARKKIQKLEKALEKIYRMPTSGVRAKNVAAKALNGTIRD
jgi:hypothetical protein